MALAQSIPLNAGWLWFLWLDLVSIRLVVSLFFFGQLPLFSLYSFYGYSTDVDDYRGYHRKSGWRYLLCLFQCLFLTCCQSNWQKARKLINNIFDCKTDLNLTHSIICFMPSRKATFLSCNKNNILLISNILLRYFYKTNY